MASDSARIKGHDLLAVERFQDDTRHMVVFEILAENLPLGKPGETFRLFLTEEVYRKALALEKRRAIKIRKHAAIIEGHILPDKKKRHRRK